MRHICVSKLTIIGSDDGLSPGRRHAIIWINFGILLIRTWRTNFSEILGEIHSFSFSKMHLKMSSVKWRLFGLGLNELNGHWVIGNWLTAVIMMESRSTNTASLNNKTHLLLCWGSSIWKFNLISGTQRRTVEVFYWSREIMCATFKLSTVGSLASENLFGETDVKLSTGFGLFYWMPQHCLTSYMHAPSLVVPRQHCYSICMLCSFWTPVPQRYPKSFRMK